MSKCEVIYARALREDRPNKPVIIAVEGYALAGGCEILMGTDMRVAAEDAAFGVPEAGKETVHIKPFISLAPSVPGWSDSSCSDFRKTPNDQGVTRIFIASPVDSFEKPSAVISLSGIVDDTIDLASSLFDLRKFMVVENSPSFETEL